MAKFTLNVNGKAHAVDVDPDMPLLYALRNDIGLNNPHFGCGLAQCGACSVLVDGREARSCVTPVSAVAKASITTIEGLGTIDRLHPLQKAFIEEQACQCGFCGNGMVIAAKALLEAREGPAQPAVTPQVPSIAPKPAVASPAKPAPSKPPIQGLADRVRRVAGPEPIETLARRLSEELKDPGSLAFYRKLAGEVRSGELDPVRVSEGVRRARSTGVKSPARIFTAFVKRLE